MASHSEVLVHIDGASRGNPGPAAYAVVMESPDGAPLTAFSKYLGKTTNNSAEYQALLAALEYALGHELRRVRVLTDSELVARQVTGHYKVKSADLKPLHERIRQMITRLESFSIQHVPREQNREADRLANRTLDAAARGDTGPQAPARRTDMESPAHDRGPAPSEALNASATYTKGLLRLDRRLPLADGEQVDVVILRRK
jgi:ribonuclease HI